MVAASSRLVSRASARRLEVQDPEGLLMKRIHALNDAGGITFPAEVVETGKQSLAVLEPFQTDPLEEEVLLATAAKRLERGISGAEISRLTRVAPGLVPRLGRKPQKRRCCLTDSTFKLGDRRANARPAPGRRPRKGRPVMHCCASCRPSAPTTERIRANLSIIRAIREFLADVQAGDVRRDRGKFATHLPGRIRLQVEHILMRRTTREEHHDERLVPRSILLRTQKTRQTRTRRPQSANAEKVTASPPVAESRGMIGLDSQHGVRAPCSEHRAIGEFLRAARE